MGLDFFKIICVIQLCFSIIAYHTSALIFCFVRSVVDKSLLDPIAISKCRPSRPKCRSAVKRKVSFTSWSLSLQIYWYSCVALRFLWRITCKTCVQWYLELIYNSWTTEFVSCLCSVQNLISPLPFKIKKKVHYRVAEKWTCSTSVVRRRLRTRGKQGLARIFSEVHTILQIALPTTSPPCPP